MSRGYQKDNTRRINVLDPGERVCIVERYSGEALGHVGAPAGNERRIVRGNWKREGVSFGKGSDSSLGSSTINEHSEEVEEREGSLAVGARGAERGVNENGIARALRSAVPGVVVLHLEVASLVPQPEGEDIVLSRSGRDHLGKVVRDKLACKLGRGCSSSMSDTAREDSSIR